MSIPNRLPRRRLAVPLAVAALVLCSLSGCGGGGANGDGANGEAAATAFARGITHPYFPIERGWTWHYVGESHGLVRAEEVRTLEQPRVIRGVECTAIEELVYEGGVLVGLTTEWFAQDAAGGVWRFGEESFERDGDTFFRTADSWLAGVDGYVAWRAFSPRPFVGERLEGRQPDGVEVLEVRALDAVADVPAGIFSGCLEIASNPLDIEDEDIILYAAGVGRVSDRDADGFTELVRISQD